VDADDIVEAPVVLVQPQSEADWSDARTLVQEYADTLGVDLSFQDFANELRQLSAEYAPPLGAFFLATEGAERLGCVGLRQFSEGVAEIKRLYIRPAARGRGLGRTLAQAAVAAGQRLGYRRLLLDTLPSMREAHALYASLGFKPVEAYRFNPVPGTAFLALELTR
jgi:GNAT superfamily N-acetyltransferase